MALKRPRRETAPAVACRANMKKPESVFRLGVWWRKRELTPHDQRCLLTPDQPHAQRPEVRQWILRVYGTGIDLGEVSRLRNRALTST